MKEPFTNLDDLIQKTKLFSDLELQAYLASLGDGRQSYVTNNISTIVDEIALNKKNNYSNVYNQLQYADNNITNANRYINKVADYAGVANQISNVTTQNLQKNSINTGVLNRQVEINEWSNFNKLDTLYILQVIFIGLCVVCILAYLMLQGLVSPYLFKFISYTIALIALIMIALRWRYTSLSRNNRYWHKAEFPRISKPVTAPPEQCAT
jgi:hypothetical protein